MKPTVLKLWVFLLAVMYGIDSASIRENAEFWPSWPELLKFTRGQNSIFVCTAFKLCRPRWPAERRAHGWQHSRIIPITAVLNSPPQAFCLELSLPH